MGIKNFREEASGTFTRGMYQINRVWSHFIMLKNLIPIHIPHTDMSYSYSHLHMFQPTFVNYQTSFAQQTATLQKNECQVGVDLTNLSFVLFLTLSSHTHVAYILKMCFTYMQLLSLCVSQPAWFNCGLSLLTGKRPYIDRKISTRI